MLQTTNPEIVKVHSIIDNLHKLLESVPFIRELEANGLVNWNKVDPDEQGRMCWAGWLIKSGYFPYSGVSYFSLPPLNSQNPFGFRNILDAAQIFGAELEPGCVPMKRTLESRAEYIKQNLLPYWQNRLSELLNAQ